MSKGIKNDEEKVPLFRGLFVQFPRAMEAVATQSAFGANKYSWGNWRNVDNGIDRYTNAMVRHLLAEAASQVYDDDSGLPHAYATAWNALARLELMMSDNGRSEQV